MLEWLKCFFEEDDATLVLKGKAFSKQHFQEIGSGSQKKVYKHEDQGLCFFIPNKWSSEEAWNNLIANEKMLLDQILNLGLKAQ